MTARSEFIDLVATAPAPTLAGDARVVLVIGRDAGGAARTAAAVVAGWRRHTADTTIVAGPVASSWPFLERPGEAGPAPTAVWVPGFHAAFANRQPPGTRLVTTQPAFLLHDWMAAHPRPHLLVATLDRRGVEQDAPDLVARPTAIQGVHIILLDDDGTWDAAAWPAGEATRLRVEAMQAATAVERLALAVRAIDRERDAAGLLVTASAAIEVGDLDAAARDLGEAVGRAPGWAAPHYEHGKLQLRRDDMAGAAASFRAAAERLPGFGAAWANLGAAEGELGRTEAAFAAFTAALRCDPDDVQAVNNAGVAARELGQLGDAEATFRRAIKLAPSLAFGYYNLGHTLFLQGRYQAALHAYQDGQRRDPTRNPVQASRAAVCRLASGDGAGALRDLQQLFAPLPRAYKQQLLADTSALVWALLTDRPQGADWALVHGWLSAELTKLA